MDVRGFLRWLPMRLGYIWGPQLMSRLRRRWVYLRHPHANLNIHPTAYLGPGFSLHVIGPGTFECGPYCQFRRNFRAEISGDGRIEIGPHTIFTYDNLIQCSTSITIGRGCLFAFGASVVDGNHRFRETDRPIVAQGYDYRPITIGDDVGVMAKATVVNDVGERSFVGANSVVTKPIPPYSVAGGVPAEVIRSLSPSPTQTP